MTTIAELQVKVDSTQAEKGIKVLNDFAAAADKAAKARKALSDASNGGAGGNPGGGGGGGDNETRRVKSLSEAIDAQTRKLASLEAQRKRLNESALKDTNPAEYARLNREIDARTELVRRQGNSLDRLAQQAKRESDARAAAAERATKEEERNARTLEARSAAEARFAASQQRNLDATIAGLSRQIKVQQEYNKTMETLNLQRFQGNLSGAEYDTYSKRAAAKRDESLAVADNTKEIERNQRMLDSITASLGRAEKAEISFARSVATLNEGLALGSITQAQYSKTLDALKNKRDLAVSGANESSAAEARLAGQLQNVLGAYNPVTRATDQFNNSVKILGAGLQSGQLTIEQFNRALGEQRAALEAVKNAQSNSPDYQAKQYQAVVDRLLPLNAQLRDLERQERILTKAKSDGKIVTEQQIKDYERSTKAIAAERKEIERKSSELTRAGNSAKQDAAALRGLPAQFTDVVVSLQGGQAPLTVLLQQGGQVKDMFGGVGNAFKAVAGALVAMINPLTVVGTALGVAAFGAYKANSEINNLKLTLATSGTVTGLTTTQVYAMAKSLDDVAYSTGRAVSVITKLAATGTVTGDNFEQMAKAIISFSHATGQSTDVLTEQLASIGKDPVAAVKTLVDKYGILNSSMLLNASQAVAYGEKRQAVTEIEKQAAIEMQLSADKIEKNLSDLQRFARATTEVFAKLGDSIVNVWRGSGDKELDAQEEVVKALENKVTLGGAYGKAMKAQYQDEYDAQVKVLDNMKATRAEEARLAAERKKANQDAVDAQGRIISRMASTKTAVESASDEIKKQQADWKLVEESARLAGRTVTQNEIDYNNKVMEGLQRRKKLAEESAARSNNPTSPIDSTGVQDVKSNLNVILSEYDGYYKKVTALGKANVVSDEATYASQKAILQAEAVAVGESYDKQISEIKRLQGVKGNNAAQNISLSNQLTKAEDGRTKFMQDNAAKQEKIEIEAKANIDKKTRSIQAYVDALNAQIDAERKAGERAVKAVSGSDRENDLNTKLSANDDKFVDDQKKLSDQLAEGAINAEEYKAKLKALTEAHQEMGDQITQNAENINAANADWQAGAIRGFKQYIDEGMNAAKLMEGFVKSSLDGMTDSLATFVLTGKADFKSLASSIISDLAKIAIKMAASQALSAIFGGMSGGGGGWGALISAGVGALTGGGGGASSAGSTAAGYGSQYFANGGAFTNSIVSSATSFGMPGGGQGIMGESGPEAIMPLTRTADGSLGVKMAGGGGGMASGGVQVYVNISSEGGVDTSASEPGLESFGKELGEFVDSRYQKLLARDLKDGGAIKTAIK